MPAPYNYIILANSNGSLSKQFRVLQESYDDGTPNRTETIQRTIGGTLDHSIGAVYITWSMVIRVLWSGDVTGYGTVSDLQTFYGYNNPNGTPSTNITFTDHHGTAHTVHMVGQMPKQALGCQIEGSQAWYLYKVSLMETT